MAEKTVKITLWRKRLLLDFAEIDATVTGSDNRDDVLEYLETAATDLNLWHDASDQSSLSISQEDSDKLNTAISECAATETAA